MEKVSLPYEFSYAKAGQENIINLKVAENALHDYVEFVTMNFILNDKTKGR